MVNALDASDPDEGDGARIIPFGGVFTCLEPVTGMTAGLRSSGRDIGKGGRSPLSIRNETNLSVIGGALGVGMVSGFEMAGGSSG
jgi:hypothetical protein